MKTSGRIHLFSRRVIILLSFFAMATGCLTLQADSQEYPPEVVKKINMCKAIPASEVESIGIGVIPPSPSHFERSKCFFKLAVAERRPDLCSHVMRLFSSRYTSENCQKKVREKIDEDKAYAAQFNGVHHHIDKAFMALDNNEKDFNLIIKVSGDKRVPYNMEWTIGDHVLYAEGRTFFKETSQVHLFVTKQELLERLGSLPFDQTHTVKVTLTKKAGRFRTKFLSEQDRFIETSFDVNFTQLKRYTGDW